MAGYYRPLLSKKQFFARLVRSFCVGISFLILSLGVGMWGYHHYEKLPWIDSFANASMILSGMGPLSPIQTEDGKLFAGFYALYSGLAFILILGIIFAPIIHRFFHKFHLQEEKK